MVQNGRRRRYLKGRPYFSSDCWGMGGCHWVNCLGAHSSDYGRKAEKTAESLWCKSNCSGKIMGKNSDICIMTRLLRLVTANTETFNLGDVYMKANQNEFLSILILVLPGVGTQETVYHMPALKNLKICIVAGKETIKERN